MYQAAFCEVRRFCPPAQESLHIVDSQRCGIFKSEAGVPITLYEARCLRAFVSSDRRGAVTTSNCAVSQDTVSLKISEPQLAIPFEYGARASQNIALHPLTLR
jgi:hypothetical protein